MLGCGTGSNGNEFERPQKNISGTVYTKQSDPFKLCELLSIMAKMTRRID
jgi:hypothetical protein